MADDRNKNQEQQGGIGEGQQGGAHQSPGRNPQDDQSAGPIGGREDRERKGGQEGGQQGGQGGQQGGSFKEGGQNEETRR